MLIVCPSCAAEYMLADDKIGPAGRRVRCSSCRWVFEVQPPEPQPEPEPEPELLPAFDSFDASPVEKPPGSTSPETAALIEDEWSKAAIDQSEVAAAMASGSQPAQTEDQGVTEIIPETPPAPMPRDVAKRVPRPSPFARVMALLLIPFQLLATAAGIALISFALIGYAIWQRDRVVQAVPSLGGVYALIGMPANIRGLKVENVRSELAVDNGTRFMVVEGSIVSLKPDRVTVPHLELVVRDAQKKTLYTWSLEPPRPTLIPGDAMRFRARLASPPEQSHDVMVRFLASGAKTSAGPSERSGARQAASPVSVTLAR